ncbi:serine hydrolase [Massilia atriviolacea]|uniref:Tetratricopeptide repeat protein n=1 Tax=Massilia atriviolacea TaxID=2495579 RepID=A0A430HUK7_9BURK|nr:serine hydrolase [Massilia atriviolacea]RSZ61054.1 tetratricopeptide repeat protein [Massilia atriviolacea]
MTRSRLTLPLLASSCVLALLAASAAAQAAAPVPATDAEILAMMKARVDIDKKGSGMVVGLIDPRGSRVLSYGTVSIGGAPADADSVYEIGSITKVFTTTLLSDMVLRGDLKLDDPIGAHLPAGVKTPAFEGKPITLRELAAQLSGLPSIPSNLAPANPGNPFADYSVPQLYAALASYRPTRASGDVYAYSNYGMGLLGHILALRAGSDVETLVRQRIATPLGMDSTAITLSADMQRRLATGYGMPGKASQNWDMPALAGMGALRSSTADMLKFVGANAGLIPSPLYPAMRATHKPQHPLGKQAGEFIGLGWHILDKFGSHIVWHNGGTAGYRTYIGFDPDTRRGVVLMSNSHSGSDDIARRALNRAFPLTMYSPPPALLDALAKRGYERIGAVYQELRAADPQLSLGEVFVNEWAYEMLRQGRLEDSLAVFKFNATQFPASSNVFDSLGEAYEKNGQLDAAIASYQRALELDPKAHNAQDTLARLKAQNKDQ